MFRNSFIVVIVITLMSCSTSKPSEASTSDSVPVQAQQRSTIAKGVLLSKTMDEQYADVDGHPCGELPCIGSVRITEIIQKGMSYHGQFHVGDTIEAHFTYTLGNSATHFPAKVPAPNSIEIQSVIEIAVRFEPDGSITVADHKETNE